MANVGALRVFTDGSCFGNGGPRATGGYSTVWPEHPQHDRGWPLVDGRNPTSNRAELAGWLAACTVADIIDPATTPSERRTLVVHTDSNLLVKTAGGWVNTWERNGWKRAGGVPVANEDLCRLVHAQLKRRAVRTVHVRAHTGGTDAASVANASADELAREAARTQVEVTPGGPQTLKRRAVQAPAGARRPTKRVRVTPKRS